MFITGWPVLAHSGVEQEGGCCITNLHALALCTIFSGYRILDIHDQNVRSRMLLFFSVSIQNNFQILPVEDNWEKGVRKEFKPFSSEIIASQVSLVVTSVRLL